MENLILLCNCYGIKMYRSNVKTTFFSYNLKILYTLIINSLFNKDTHDI